MWFVGRVVIPLLATFMVIVLSEVRYDESVPTWAIAVLFLLWNLAFRGDD